ncbi:hypothetical protein PHET_07000 [Paragonimus heterotremus]|uniref:Uncharacterized protein n=1 Tax=Paragonimus heterotremus TaxID=100268 RepID=A0A8J4WXR4_9TREM|nr:hypothetical protein PHET_07000 [Paragonimus heterotremus]
MSIDVSDSVAAAARADAIAQEKIWLSVLRQTNDKLAKSIEMIEAQLESIHDEGNEWKTRYEIQKEINDYYKKAFFISDQHIPKAKSILLNKATRRGSKIAKQLELDEDPNEMLEEYQDYMYRLCKELECRIEQEGKAYYWATDIRKRALIELNYTYVPAPTTKAVGEKTNKGDEFMLNSKQDKPRRTFHSKYGLTNHLGNVKKLPPMHF